MPVYVHTSKIQHSMYSDAFIKRFMLDDYIYIAI